jgi:hypothetical protein
MKFALSKSRIVQILLSVVIVLIVVNIILEKYFQSRTLPGEISAATINQRFNSALNNYNLDSSWIVRDRIRNNTDDSLKFKYNVNVPADLPVSLLIREIQNLFDTSEVNIYSAEFKSNRTTDIKISSGGHLKLEALLRTNTAVLRKTDTIGFVLKGIEKLNNEELNTLLLLPEHFACILIPSKHSQELLKLLRENQKQAAVLLNDDIPELEFKLKTGYSGRRIKNSVVSIIRKFYNAAFFVVDDKSDIYKSVHYKMIKNEFVKRNLLLISRDKFEVLTDSSPEDIVSKIRNRTDNKKVFLINAEEFLEMPPLLAGLRKTGYKFINPSALIAQ